MDVDEILKERNEVEDKIDKLLSEFEEKVGLKVSSISVNRREMIGMGRHKSTNTPAVSLEIKT